MRRDELHDLLTRIIMKSEVFTQTPEVDIWKSAYDMIYGIEVAAKLNVDFYKKYENFNELGGPELIELDKISNQFAKKMEKKGFQGTIWCGEDEECARLMNEYKQKASTVLRKMIKITNPPDAGKLEKCLI